jgi:hypothetical protein
LIVLFLRVFDITCTVENLEGRVDLNREMTEGVTELIYVKLEGVIIARANTYLIKISEVLVDLTDEIFLRESVGDSLFEFAVVGIII